MNHCSNFNTAQTKISGEKKYTLLAKQVPIIALILFSFFACVSGGSPINITRGGEGGDIPNSDSPTSRSGDSSSASDLKIQSSTSFNALITTNPALMISGRSSSQNYIQEDSMLNLGNILFEGSAP